MKAFLQIAILGVLLYLVHIYYPRTPDWQNLSEAEWRTRLTPEQFEVLREGGTEDAFTGSLCKEKRPGLYRCAGCHSPLFVATSKFESGTGWPSFDATRPEAVTHRQQDTFLGVAVEVRCSTCNGHLGHVFPDGPTDTGNRYCINSIALEFEPEE